VIGSDSDFESAKWPNLHYCGQWRHGHGLEHRKARISDCEVIQIQVPDEVGGQKRNVAAGDDAAVGVLDDDDDDDDGKTRSGTKTLWIESS